MGLESLLKERKAVIVKRWFESAIQAYPPETAKFIKGQKDRFANPIGGTTLAGIEGLFDQLLGDMNPDQVKPLLDPIIRIRAVQAFTPSQATAFVLSLKSLLRDALSKHLHDREVANDLLALEARIDALCLMAFDVYQECREAIYRIQANEMKNLTQRAFERAGLLKKSSEDPSNLK
jgi:hypothetical protein